MNFVYAVSISIIAACIFYLFQVYIPEKRKREIIKANFENTYYDFKRSCISIFLSTQGASYDSQLPEKLLILEEFKVYFKEKKGCPENQDRWDVLLNGLEKDNLQQLLVEFEILSNEIDYILNNIAMHDEEVFLFLKRFKIIIYSLKDTTDDYDDIKRLSQFLWELFTGWSFVSGYREEDFFKKMMSRI